MAFTFEWGFQPCFQDRPRQFRPRDPAAKYQDVRIIMCATHPSMILRRAKGCPDSPHTIGRDRHPEPRSANKQAAGCLSSLNPRAQVLREIRIVARGFRMAPDIRHGDPLLVKDLFQKILKAESRVV